MAKYGNESTELLNKFRVDKSTGAIVKRFKDEFIVFDLLKILYDDNVDSLVKTELLVDLEEYGHLSLTSESVDQVVTSLLDIVNQHEDTLTNWTYVCQSLITSTSLVIQLDQLETDICKQLVKVLVSIVTNTNHPDNQRLRSCACHCLIHMEEFQPGLLFGHSDEFSRFARQEKSCIYQDYALLAVKVLENIGSISLAKLSSPTSFERDTNRQQSMVQKQMSYDPQDVRQFSAFLLENIGLLTRCGYFRVVQSIAEIVKTFPDVSPMVFKPLMLHQMSTVSCVLFQTIMYLQREFQGEILTEKERSEFLHRLCIMTDHPCLTLMNKLLVTHWAKFYYLDVSPAGDCYRLIIQRLRFKFYPSVFDQVDCQLSKLIMTSLCVNKEDNSGLETSVLLGSLAYIHKLAWHTGSSQVAIVMFKALYYMYQRLNNDSFSNDIQRFLRGLCTDLPHFIPHTIDFLDSIQELQISSTIYVETLDLLHKQVVMATEDQIEKSYHFYLQILKKAACEKNISQASSLQFLHSLAERAQYLTEDRWNLGHRILETCRNFLLYQGTDQYYTAILKKKLQTTLDAFLEDKEWIKTADFDDSVKASPYKKAEITIWEIITIVTSAVAIVIVVFGLVKIYKKGLISANHTYIYLTACLIGCFLLCISLTIGAFLNIFRTYCTKTWHLCFYFEVVKSSLSEWIGVCLILSMGDLLYSLVRLTENSMDDLFSQRIFSNILTVASAVVLVVINSMTEHSFDDFPKTVSCCSKQTVFLNHLNFWAYLEMTVKSMIVIIMLSLIMGVTIAIKHKLKTEGSVESSVNGSKSGNESGESGEDTDFQSFGDTLNRQGSRKNRLDDVGVDNIGFVPDMDIVSSNHWDPVSCSLSQMDLARRYSHTTTMDTFVQLYIGQLLYYMMVYYDDVDVQDKAKFYYSLLIGASDTKIQSVLKATVYDASSVNQTISALLPGSIQGKRLSKITHLEESIFTWERISVCMKTSKTEKRGHIEETKENDVFQQYQSYLAGLDVVVEIKCRLKLIEQSKLSTLHALCIKISPTQACGPIPDNFVTVLTTKGQADVVLKMRPFIPVPQTLSGSVSFICPTKETYDVNLPDISITFSHMMMPLPWRPDGDTYSAKEFFECLWRWTVGGSDNDRFGVESLKLFDLPLTKFKTKYSDRLGKFEITGHQSDEKESLYVIFMPPKHHILLHCKDQMDKVVVAMAMDDWSLLPHVDKFLMDS